MNPVNFQNEAALEAALRRAERLWPDPFDAPEVPSRDVLGRYLLGGQAHLPHEHGYRIYLPGQISESVNCQRALEQLRAEADPMHILHAFVGSRAEPEIEIPSAWAEFKARRFAGALAPRASAHAKAYEHPAPQLRPPPEIDQIWATSHRVEQFNDSQRPASRYTWQPVNVLLAEGPIAANEDVLWRAMPCTPLEVWGTENVGAEEALVLVPGVGEYVVHFGLEYPVSARQLVAPIGTAGDGPLEPGPARITDELRIERLRLQERAAWLTATADARRLLYTAREEHAKVDERGSIYIEHRRGELQIANMAGVQPSFLCLLWRSGMAALHAAVLGGGTLEGCHEFVAQAEHPPQPNEDHPGECWAIWNITDETAVQRLREGDVFHVVKHGRITDPIGHGFIRRIKEGLQADLENGLWPDFRDVRACDLALLFPSLR